VMIADAGYPLLVDTKPGDTFINTGMIQATGPGGVMFNNGTFRNEGTIEVHEGSKVFYTVSAVESSASFSTLSAGVWKVYGAAAPASLILSGPGLLFNDADVTLSGPGALFQAFNTVQVNYGRFALEQGRAFNTAGSGFSNPGILEISGGSRLNVAGTYTQESSGLLRLVLGGSSSGAAMPAIVATGTASLAGTVQIELAPGFIPQNGQVLHVIEAAAISGSFTNIIVPAGFQISYAMGDVSFSVTSSCTGDLDGSGMVSEPDVQALLPRWGPCHTGTADCVGDLNHDRWVDAVDLQLLLSLFGSCP